MIDYGKPASNQMELGLPGFTSEGKELMNEARLWAGRHYEEFQWYKRLARENSAQGKVSPNFALQCMRDRFKVSIPNSYAPALARIAMEEDPSIEFRTAKSRLDGFTTAKL